MTFFLHLDGSLQLADAVEIDAADLADARRVAIKGIRDILCHDVLAGEINLLHQIDITDTEGTVLQTVPFGEAVVVRA